MADRKSEVEPDADRGRVSEKTKEVLKEIVEKHAEMLKRLAER